MTDNRMRWLADYLRRIDDIRRSGKDTEMSYRLAIGDMLKQAKDAHPETKDIDIIHEPRRQGGSAPDFGVYDDGGGAVIGYIECKKPGENLRALLTGEQLKRYADLSPNIILTDGWHWLLLREGKIIVELNLAVKAERGEPFLSLLHKFFTAEAKKVGNAKELAAALAARCNYLREELEARIGDDRGRLRGLYEAFQTHVHTEMTEEQFADTFAQTTVYSLLLAGLRAEVAGKLDLITVKRYIPKTFAVIRELSGFLDGLEDNQYRGLSWIIKDVLAIIGTMDAVGVVETMSRAQTAGVNDDDDPFMYFYESFLAAYNAKLRKARGVYYTPKPVVRFIVRTVDDILKRDFAMPGGLANDGVTSLDFAAGTGTFMLETIRQAMADKGVAERQLLIKERLLPNCYGFEFLIAPYVIAHLKLSQFLKDKDYPFDEDKEEKQLKIFLTDTLSGVLKQYDIPFMPALTAEMREAGKVKENPILVIMGNPPYSGHSQTASVTVGARQHKRDENKTVKDIKDTWIGGLLRDYYQVDGKGLGEKNPKWLQDDYVKFIRFAQHKMETVECGIVAIITNHSFMDNPTFRGMRQSLMKTFQRLYFLDLHGNTKKKETAPDGGKDENVFDIQQGVAVSLLVKNPKLSKGIFHYDVFGKRGDKYEFCERESGVSVDWKELEPDTPYYLFIPQDKRAEKEYLQYPSIKDIFRLSGVGITTAHDDFVIDFDSEVLIKRFSDFVKSKRDDKFLHATFDVKEKKGWDILRGYDALLHPKSKRLNEYVKEICYRPFDKRHIFYEDNLVWRTVRKVMRHILEGENIGLITTRQVKAGRSWQHCLVTNLMIESSYLSSQTSEIGCCFPLYLDEEDIETGTIQKNENLNPKFRKWINEFYGQALSPEDIIGYIYAVLHSPDYRRRYADFLRLDFPRIPFAKEYHEFQRLAQIGRALINAHLLKNNDLPLPVSLHGSDLEVVKVGYLGEERLSINNGSYFAPIAPEVYNFAIGGYLPLDKYLKSRKGRKLTLADIETIKKAAAAITFTLQKTAEIDY